MENQKQLSSGFSALAILLILVTAAFAVAALFFTFDLENCVCAAMDLGKAASITLASLDVVAYTAVFALYLINAPLLASKLIAVSWFVMSIVCLLMTVTKYIDKTGRNTK